MTENSSTPAGTATMSRTILETRVLAVLGAQVSRVFANQCEPPVPLEAVLPPIAHIEGLPETVADVLAGNPGAPAKLRAELARLSTNRRRRGVSDWIAAVTPKLASCSCDEDQPPALKVHPLLPAEQWVHLVAATVYASRTRQETAAMLEALLDGMRGFGALARLSNAAKSASDDSVTAAWNALVRQLYSNAGQLPSDVDAAQKVDRFERPDEGALPRLIRPIGSYSTLPNSLDPGLAEMPPDLPDWMMDCLRETTAQVMVSGYGVEGVGYSIDSVTPEFACPGDMVVITGSGFEGVEAVELTGPDGRPVGIAPLNATSTSIEVEFPATAASGPVWLYIPQRVPLCSGISSLLARPGQPGEILGGVPRIHSFDFYFGDRCLQVDVPYPVAWSVDPAGAQVFIREHSSGAPFVLHSTTDPEGVTNVRFGSSQIGTQELDILVYSSCSPIPAEERITIQVGTEGALFSIPGVEITQGIQTFTPEDYSNPTNNRLAPIAGKSTVVRVYVKNETGGGSNATITGVLRMDGIEYAPINRDAAGQPFIPLGAVSDRTNVDGTLNFLIPSGAATSGSHTVEIEVFSVDACPIASASFTTTIIWIEYPAYPVTVLRIAEPDTGASVTRIQALVLVTRAFDFLPSNILGIRLARTEFQIHPGTTEANYCRDAGYYQLALSVAYRHNWEEGGVHRTAYLGIHSRTDCTANGMMSWPYTSTCISESVPRTIAHELAHTVGLGHTWGWCEDVFQPVSCYRPEPAPGLNTEVVFDIWGNAVVLDAPDLQSGLGAFRFLRPELWVRARGLMNTRF